MYIAIINNKGGMRTTTVSVNLACQHWPAGRRPLVIDLDGQANTNVIFCPEIPREGNIVDIFERHTFRIRIDP